MKISCLYRYQNREIFRYFRFVNWCEILAHGSCIWIVWVIVFFLYYKKAKPLTHCKQCDAKLLIIFMLDEICWHRSLVIFYLFQDSNSKPVDNSCLDWIPLCDSVCFYLLEIVKYFVYLCMYDVTYINIFSDVKTM